MKINLDQLKRDLGATPAPKRKRGSGAAPANRVEVFAGETVCFTGKFESGFTREQLHDLVRSVGGTPVNHVSKDLDILVTGKLGSPQYGANNKRSRVPKKTALFTERSFLKLLGIKYGKL